MKNVESERKLAVSEGTEGNVFTLRVLVGYTDNPNSEDILAHTAVVAKYALRICQVAYPCFCLKRLVYCVF